MQTTSHDEQPLALLV